MKTSIVKVQTKYGDINFEFATAKDGEEFKKDLDKDKKNKNKISISTHKFVKKIEKVKKKNYEMWI